MKKQKSDTTKRVQSSTTLIPLLLLQIIILTSIHAAPTSAQAPFNLKIEISDAHDVIPAGENLIFTTKLINLVNQKRIDVTLKYDIFDANNQLKSTKSETVAVETQASFVGQIKLPKTLKGGMHILKVTLTSPNGKSSAEASFEVAENKKDKQTYYGLTIIAILTAIALLSLLAAKSKGTIKKLKIKAEVYNIVSKKLKKKR